MVSEVAQMLGLHEQLGAVETPNKRAMVERQKEAVNISCIRPHYPV